MYGSGQGIKQNSAQAVASYKKAAERGYVDAQYKLAVLYDTVPDIEYDNRERDEVVQNDVEAAKWYRLAAEQGHAHAQYRLGLLNAEGRGVAKNEAEAMKWYRKAAELGDVDAQYTLADMFYSGWGVEWNDAEAFKWLSKAAENGLADAQYELGKRYVEGTGLVTDYAQAAKWLEKALEQGEDRAKEILEYVNYQMKTDFSCDDISGKNCYNKLTRLLFSLKMNEMRVCLKKQTAWDLCTPFAPDLQYRPPQEQEKIDNCRDHVLTAHSTHSPDDLPETVTIYSIIQGRQPIAADGGVFELKGSQDEISDIVSLDINGDGKDELVVIRESNDYTKSQKTTYPRSTLRVYVVTVFDQGETGLHRNERASEWFGGDFYRWYSDAYTTAFDFPYITGVLVQGALKSPYAPLMVGDASIPVTVRCKSHLYEHPSLETKSNKYLITGDKATVDKYTAGWCRLNYSGGKKPLQMWMRCDGLLPEGQSDARECPYPITEEKKRRYQMLNISG